MLIKIDHPRGINSHRRRFQARDNVIRVTLTADPVQALEEYRKYFKEFSTFPVISPKTVYPQIYPHTAEPLILQKLQKTILGV